MECPLCECEKVLVEAVQVPTSENKKKVVDAVEIKEVLGKTYVFPKVTLNLTDPIFKEGIKDCERHNNWDGYVSFVGLFNHPKFFDFLFGGAPSQPQ